jgi:DNA-binding response OmpR family regulator
MLNILLFTQDQELVNKINVLTQKISCSVKTARVRKEAINYICNNPVSLCAIDLDNDGDGFCAALKLIDDNIPTVIFSNDDSEHTKLSAFEKGCDDYILKTVSLKEIQFRIQSILKRTTHLKEGRIFTQNTLNDPISIGNSVIDFSKRSFYTQKEQIALSKKEASLLRLFYLNKGKLLKREEILKEIWNTSDYYASKSMDVYLSKLRKILSYEQSVSIQNIHGTGYMFVEQKLNELNELNES